MSRGMRRRSGNNRSWRRIVAFDQVLGTPEKLYKMQQDEFGRWTSDPDMPHPQRKLLPVPMDRQRIDPVLPPSNLIPGYVSFKPGDGVLFGNVTSLPGIYFATGGITLPGDIIPVPVNLVFGVATIA